jgi:hypothetical protein
MKKILLVLSLILVFNITSFAQSGNATGIFGSYYMSQLANRDDVNADARLDLVTTFRWSAGIDKIWWANENFGTGMQVSYATAGQDYSGVDTFTKGSFKASTTLNYVKGAFLIYHRSHNRYNPEARFRFCSYFGPYFAFMPSYKDQYDMYDAGSKQVAGDVKTFTNPITKEEKQYLVGSVYYDNSGVKDVITGRTLLKLKGTTYKNYDFGFIVAPGFQFMMTPKMALCFNIRGDFGLRGLESTSDLTQVLDNPNPPYDKARFYGWDNMYAKYWPYPDGYQKPTYDTRGLTKNFNVGAVLGIKIYAYRQFSK